MHKSYTVLLPCLYTGTSTVVQLNGPVELQPSPDPTVRVKILIRGEMVTPTHQQGTVKLFFSTDFCQALLLSVNVHEVLHACMFLS